MEEECKPVIIRDADKALHLLFPERLTDLTKVKQRLDLISHKFIQKLRPLFQLIERLVKELGVSLAEVGRQLGVSATAVSKSLTRRNAKES